MPEIRYVRVYENGKLVNEEPYEVSDEELEREGAEKTVAELSTLNDSDFTVRQVAKFVKALAKLRR
jgi:hypothetical protein